MVRFTGSKAGFLRKMLITTDTGLPLVLNTLCLCLCVSVCNSFSNTHKHKRTVTDKNTPAGVDTTNEIRAELNDCKKSATVMMRKFIDIGANLADPVFQGFYNRQSNPKHPPDLNHVLNRAFNQGVAKIIITGTNLETSKKAIEIANTDERLFATVGVHPTQCQEFHQNDCNEYTNSLKELIKNNKDKVVAYGEFGLDYDRLEFCPADLQKKYFLHQLNISKEFNLPLFLHMRACDKDFIQYLEDKNETFRGVVHSFDGDLEALTSLLKLGFYIGINGCSMKKDTNLSVIKQIPRNRLLIETDSPWCDIRPSHASFPYVKTNFSAVKKEKWNENSLVKSRNEPCNIVQVFEVIAEIRDENPDELAEEIYRNTEILFFTK